MKKIYTSHNTIFGVGFMDRVDNAEKFQRADFIFSFHSQEIEKL